MKNRFNVQRFFSEPPEGPDIRTSQASQGVSRVYSKDNILTLFTSGKPDESPTTQIRQAFVSSHCDPNIAFATGSVMHPRWHKDPNEIFTPHFHIFNAKTGILPPNDL